MLSMMEHRDPTQYVSRKDKWVVNCQGGTVRGMEEEFVLPKKPFFACDEDGFSIVDGALMQGTLDLLQVEPILKLHVGHGNVFEQRPVKITSRDGDVVTVECEGGVVVRLDFGDMLARVVRPDGEFLYKGGLEDGNDGLGFISAR